MAPTSREFAKQPPAKTNRSNKSTLSPEEKKRRAAIYRKEREKEKAKQYRIPKPIDLYHRNAQNAQRHTTMPGYQSLKYHKNVDDEAENGGNDSPTSVPNVEDESEAESHSENKESETSGNKEIYAATRQDWKHCQSRYEEEPNDWEEGLRNEQHQEKEQQLSRLHNTAICESERSNCGQNKTGEEPTQEQSVRKIKGGLTTTRLPNLIKEAVRSVLFKSVKFITSDEQWSWAIDRVLDCVEGIDELNTRPFLHLNYKNVILDTLNVKRSSCEQAMTKIVMDKIKQTRNEGTDMHNINDLLLLTKGNYETFKWLIGSLVESVAGRREWGQQKYSQKCSVAKNTVTGLPFVSVSDEAVALLFFDNYIMKWTQWASPGGKLKFCVDDPAKKMRYLGKYTRTATGSSHFTGWNKNGLRRYNEFCMAVKEDRESPTRDEWETRLVEELRASPEGIKNCGPLPVDNGGANEDDDDPEDEVVAFEDELF